jgi:serine/threonine protein kinase/Tol biopolymer transport system component
MSMIGKTLAHYEITSQLGKGGMGEVYQAKDRKLGRDVAIKVLPEEFARDTDRVSRFQREAKLLASLNHPNIAAIHGLEESGGIQFLVLELVEGETLADQLKRGPIPVEESLKLALQIAEALEAAHEKGVIHRDLKPANIKVTPDGKVKVLDFGLAKAFAGEQADLNLSNSPTLSDAATQQGVILGTAAYMSPEQARGKPVDRRADIWAFGVVLYEMLTGKSLFGGDDVSQTLARVLERQPDFSTLPPNIHPRIRLLLERCLEKAARNRYGSISDARVDIEKALAEPHGAPGEHGAPEKSRAAMRQIMPRLAAAVVLTAIIAGALIWYLKPAPPQQPRQIVRLDHILPEDQQIVLQVETGHTLAVSPDGSQFAYTTRGGIYVRSTNELNASLIAGTEEDNPQSPFFSPDAQWIGYWSQKDSKLKKIPIRGGMSVTLCAVGSGKVFGAGWYPDGTIVYADFRRGVFRVSENGGTPEMLVKGLSVSPQLLPDGKSLLFTNYSRISSPKIVVQELSSGKQKELFPGEGARYLPTGHLVYGLVNSSNLFAIPFDLQKLETTGGGFSIVEGVGPYAVSDSGTLVYLPETSGPVRLTPVWVYPDGKEEPLGAPPDNYQYPKISPDGTRVAFTVTADNSDIWVWNIMRKTMTQLTFEKSSEIQPVWTPDSRQIFYWSRRDDVRGSTYRKSADGTGEEEKIFTDPSRTIFAYCIANDGKLLLTAESRGGGSWQIGALSLGGNVERKPLLDSPDYSVGFPSISPDGNWLAYASTESAKGDIFVRPFPDVNKGRWPISTNGGSCPLWSPDGRELYYLSEDDRAVTAVPVRTGMAFSAGTARKLFSRNAYLESTPGSPWDIHPDGKRFLMLKKAGTTVSTRDPWRRITIILNWFEELKQRVPVK